MGKPKTNKSAQKRFKITKKKKILYRPVHQNHFNAKDSGDQTRGKRGFNVLSSAFKKNIKGVIKI